MSSKTPSSVPAAAPAHDDPHAAGCAWVEGEYVPMDQARVPVLDWGFVRCDLTYDVVAVWRGAFFRLEDHLDRLWGSCERLRLTPPVERKELREIMFECVRRSGLRDVYVEAIVTRGIPAPGVRDPRTLTSRLYAYAVPYVWIVRPEQLEAGTDVVVARETVRIPPTSLDPTAKNYHWGDLQRGQFEAYDRGATYSILTDGHGNVTEGAGYNVFALVDGTLHTCADGVLLGITRRTALEIAEEMGIPTVVDTMPVALLEQAEEIFLTSTAGGVMGVATLDGRPVGDGAEGPVTRRIRDHYWKLHSDPRHATPVDYRT